MALDISFPYILNLGKCYGLDKSLGLIPRPNGDNLTHLLFAHALLEEHKLSLFELRNQASKLGIAFINEGGLNFLKFGMLREYQDNAE